MNNTGRTISNPLTVAAGSTGARVIQTIGNGQTFNFAGPVTLNSSLTLSTFAGNTNNLLVSGNMTGAGGLNINAQCQVLKPDGKTLPNLYAAGGAARGVSGTEVWGYLSGNGLLSAIAGGHIAAHAVAQKLRDNK
jgi:hypothetical protein